MPLWALRQGPEAAQAVRELLRIPQDAPSDDPEVRDGVPRGRGWDRSSADSVIPLTHDAQSPLYGGWGQFPPPPVPTMVVADGNDHLKQKEEKEEEGEEEEEEEEGEEEREEERSGGREGERERERGDVSERRVEGRR